MTGALLLADISGFTAITERLAERGPGGAEELRVLLDGAFQPLLELIAGTGGDVLKFAGDALLACWPAPPGDLDGDRGLAAATAAAAGCAQAMQAALGRYAAAERLPLALRIGVGAGEVVVLDVGGERERRELLVAGAAVPQTTDAAGQAMPGQVRLSEAAMRLLARDLDGQARQRGPGPPRPPPAPTASAAQVAPYLPRAMLASMVAGHEEWLAELRQITVVFANLPDLDHRAAPGRGPGGDGGPPEAPCTATRAASTSSASTRRAPPWWRRSGCRPWPTRTTRPGASRPPWPCARPWPPAAAGSRSG